MLHVSKRILIINLVGINLKVRVKSKKAGLNLVRFFLMNKTFD